MSVDIFKGTALAAGSPLTGLSLPSLSGSSGLGSIFGAGIDLFNAGYGVYQDQRNWKYTQALNAQQQKNYEEQFQFQKDVWEQTKQREDTAISRRVRDMQAAGINPVAATGAGAASVGTVSTPSMISPHSSTVHLGNTTFQNAIAKAQFQAQLAMQNSQIQLANAETELKRAQARSEAMKPAQIEAQTKLILNNSKLTEEDIESKNYKQVEEAIVASFIAEHPEFKKEQVQAELQKTGLENDLTKEKTKASKWKRIQDSIKLALYGLNTVVSFGFF